MNDSINIIFAEDKVNFRRTVLNGLKDLGVNCVGEADNGAHLLTLQRLWEADVILLDLEMPLMDGSKAMDELMLRYPEIKILIVSFHYDPLLIDDYLKRGARGYVSKDVVCGNLDVLVTALKKIKNGEIFVYDEPRLHEKKFTQRQVEIIPLICDEQTNKQIASKIGIGERSVEKLRQKIYEKVGATGTTSFLKYAFRQGLDFLKRKN